MRLPRRSGRARADRARSAVSLMPELRECPLCGESMRFAVRERVEPIPGTGQTTRRQVREWICPQCDYFEEIETDQES